MKWRRRKQQPDGGGIPVSAEAARPHHNSIFTPPEPFADRYTELHLVGRGGFGDVYRAWDTQMERRVALKLLKRELALDADWRKRFRQEATRNLLHPNITVNFDIGHYQEQPFIVMELVEGDPLSKVIERQVPLTDVERLSLLEQLCDGLHYAHTQQVVHRDIKPANLMVCEKQQGDRMVRTLKILDFGIARVVSTEETSSSSFMFSPPYVSPEQVKGEPTDGRSDMFAVGAVAYELLSFQKAFDIQSKNLFEVLNEVLRKNAEQPHRPLPEIRPDIDPELSAVIDRALAKRPADRFSSLAEMGRQLRRVRERLEDEAGGDSSPTVVLSATIRTTVREARLALEAGDPTAALSKLEHALASRPTRAERRVLEEVLADAREQHYQKSGARHQNDQAAVADAVEWARAAFANGQRTAAIDRLARFEPVELVVDELETLRATKAALAHAEHAVYASTPAEAHDAIDRLERSCRPELISEEVIRLRQLVDAKPAPAIGQTRWLNARRRILAPAGIVVVVAAIISFAADRWWRPSETPADSAALGAPAPDPAAEVRERISDLWRRDQGADSVSELEKALARWERDPQLIQLRDRMAVEAKAASEQARQRAEEAGAGADELFGVAAAAAARAQTHATNGRHVDTIRGYLDAAGNYNRALQNVAPVAAVDALLAAGDRAAALDALSRGLKTAPGNPLLRQRLDRLRADALRAAEIGHQTLTRQKSFDQNAPDYGTARQEYEAARSRDEPASIRVLWGLPARFKAAGERMSEAAANYTRGLERMHAGQHQEALTILRDARARYPGYRATRQLGEELRQSAAELTQRTKKAAAGAGASAQTSVAFADGLEAEQQAGRATSDEASIETFREATRLFAVAEKEGRRTPPPPGPVVAPPGPVVPPVVKAPATANPGARDKAAEEADIRAAIDEYKRGYREMNPAVILAVYPTFSRERQKQLRDAAASCKAYPVEFAGGLKIDFFEGAERATVTARATYGCDPKRGGKIDLFPPSTEFFSLQKEGGRWVITDMPGR